MIVRINIRIMIVLLMGIYGLSGVLLRKGRDSRVVFDLMFKVLLIRVVLVFVFKMVFCLLDLIKVW